jgi:glycine dehydrogenase
MNFRYFDANTIGISLDESVTYEDLLDLAGLFADLSGKPLPEISEPSTASFPASLNRTSAYLNQGIFNAHHSEHEMLRYIKSLENKDLSLNTSMIALGS